MTNVEELGWYKVGIEADELEGWTQKTLITALTKPLAELGFEVEDVGNSTVLDSIVFNSNAEDEHGPMGFDDLDSIRRNIEDVVEKIIEKGM